MSKMNLEQPVDLHEKLCFTEICKSSVSACGVLEHIKITTEF